MKHTLLLLVCICAANLANAQLTSGKITYEEAITMTAPADLPVEAGFLKDIFSKGMHNTRVLIFNQDAAVFRAEQKQEQASGTTGDGGEMQIRFNIPEEITYTDLKAGTTVEQRDLMGKKFLVSGDATRRKWQMTGKQKEILNYPCQEAVSYGKDTLLAWFTTSIPVSAGPPEWRGLPGMVMEGSRVMGEQGSYSIKATKVEEGAQALSVPKEGKKVTKAEFEKIQKEKEKEMAEQFGGHGNGHMMIRVER